MKNIDIDFSKSKFDSDEKITKSSLKVNCDDGSSGSTSSSLFVARVGFAKNCQNGAGSSFSIGVVD